MPVANLYNFIKICNIEMVELLQNICKFSELNFKHSEFSVLCVIRVFKLKQDACRGVHSACRREVNRHKLDICVRRLRQGRIQAFSYVGQNFLVLKWGVVLISIYGIAIEHMKQKEQYHSFSACVDAGYDIKESITDIPRDIQQTMQ